MVVDAICLARARTAGRVRNGESEGIRVPLVDTLGPKLKMGNRKSYLEQEVVEGPLADARGARNNDWTGIANDCRIKLV